MRQADLGASYITSLYVKPIIKMILGSSPEKRREFPKLCQVSGKCPDPPLPLYWKKAVPHGSLFV